MNEKDFKIKKNNTNSHHYNETEDFITDPPNWILKSGITIIAFVVTIGIILSFIISYPDKLKATVIITTELPPLDLISKTNGKIESVFIHDKDTVMKGEKLFYIENAANPKDIGYVESFLKKYEEVVKIKDYLLLNFNDKLITGELSSEISAFSLKFRGLQNLLIQSIVFKKINSINTEIKKNIKLNQILEKQIKLYHIEVKIKEKDYNRKFLLFNQNVISEAEKERNEAQLLGAKRQLESMNIGVINNKIRIEHLTNQVLELTDQRHQDVNAFLSELSELITIINNQIIKWREKYYIISPINGIVTIPNSLFKDVYITQSKKICSIVPILNNSHINKKVAQAISPISGVGKIKIGSKTIIRLDAYPYKEYGSLDTKVKDISLLPRKNNQGEVFYDLLINLPDTLKTNYNIIIPYRPNMTGTALIISNNKTIIERIFNKFFYVFRN